MFDLIIRGGDVIDGTGAPPVRADVGVRGRTIAAVEPSLPAEAREVLDATGRIVTPGFVDAHTHCDASIPTYLLTHWVRDRTRGPRLELTDAVRRLTSQPADLYRLTDRGRIEVGRRADLNVIDTANLHLGMPVPVADLPAGGTRLLQEATGYDATIVGGEITRRNGRDTGARPGRLLRRS
jgi:N-acyl-D-amino-acid deacylase